MVKQYKNDIELINTNVRDDLIAELDANISGFRDIAWRSTSKRFTKKDAKTIKYELAILVTNSYWGHIKKHKVNNKWESLYYETLKAKLGKNYRKYIDTCYDIQSGVAISSFRKRDGHTQKYKLKKKVRECCDRIFLGEIKRHRLMNRDGSVMTDWSDYAVSKLNEKGEFQQKVDNKKYKFDSKVLLNKNNGTILTHLFSDLYKYKTGRKTKAQVQRWIDIIKEAGGDINDGNRWDGERLEKLHKSSLEIYNKMMTDIIGEGYVGQIYKERNTGRLYATGYTSLQSMQREQRRIIMGGLGYYEYDMENAHYAILEQYYNMLTNRKLKRVREYMKNTKAIRYRLVKETGNDYRTIKQCLISLIYGGGISDTHNTIEGITNKSGIYETIEKQHSSKKLVQECWERFVSNKIVVDLHAEVDIAYRVIKQSWIETGSGKGRRVKNMSNKTAALYRLDRTELREKSKGQLLSHFLQGIEARILLGIINEEGRTYFVMPHHDGWVSKLDWNIKRLEQLIAQDTRKMLLDYNGIQGAFDIRIKKVQLHDVVEGDWVETILSKGLVDTIH